MKTLRDVLPAGPEIVILRKKLPEADQIRVPVRGIDFGDLGGLFSCFPEIYDAFNKALNGKQNEIAAIDWTTVGKELPEKAIVALIAAGAGGVGDEEVERGIKALSMLEKLALLVPIMKRTIGEGDTDPLLELLRLFGINPDVMRSKLASEPNKRAGGRRNAATPSTPAS